MSLRQTVSSIASLGLLATAALVSVTPAKAGAFTFNYTLPPNLALCPLCTSLSASGTLTTSAPSGGFYTITAITGTWNGIAITGLLPPNTYAGNDNMLTTASLDLTFNGMSFTVAAPTGGDDGSGDVNIYLFAPAQYFETNNNYLSTSTINVTPIVSGVPEPSSVGLAALGLGALAFWRRRK